MTLILRMDPEPVLVCAYQLRTNSIEIRQQAQSLAASVRSLEWYSPVRDHFQAEMEHLALSLNRLADEGEVLAARLERESDQWQQLDEHFAGQYRQAIVSLNLA